MADALVPLLDASEEEIAGSALQALAQVGNPRCLPASIAELAEPRWPPRSTSTRAVAMKPSISECKIGWFER